MLSTGQLLTLSSLSHVKPFAQSDERKSIGEFRVWEFFLFLFFFLFFNLFLGITSCVKPSMHIHDESIVKWTTASKDRIYKCNRLEWRVGNLRLASRKDTLDIASKIVLKNIRVVPTKIFYETFLTWWNVLETVRHAPNLYLIILIFFSTNLSFEWYNYNIKRKMSTNETTRNLSASQRLI